MLILHTSVAGICLSCDVSEVFNVFVGVSGYMFDSQ